MNEVRSGTIARCPMELSNSSNLRWKGNWVNLSIKQSCYVFINFDVVVIFVMRKNVN